MTIEAWGMPVLLGVLGLVFGSFIATLAIRWPEGRGVSKGRSACDACDKALRAHELVPVLSYMLQRGRCRECAAKIHPTHFLVELAALAVGLTAALVAPPAEAAAGAVFGWLLLALAALDLTHFWLPNRLTGALAVTGVVAALLGTGPPILDRLIGGAAGFGVLWLVSEAYLWLRGRRGLGGGDPKMFGAIGLWLGWQQLPFVLLLACAIGLALVGLMALGRRRPTGSDRLPFGVMLALGGFAAWILWAMYPDGTVLYWTTQPL